MRQFPPNSSQDPWTTQAYGNRPDNTTGPSMLPNYSHLFNKRGGGAKVAKSLNLELGIKEEGGIFGKKLVHKT